MLDPYRRVLARPGALTFSVSGLVARLPLSMVGLGIVLLVSATSGSYAVAGSVSAAYVVTNATLALPQGRLLDRVGQRVVLVPLVLVFAAALSVMAVSAYAEWPIVTTYVTAGIAGAALPAIGACVRARWSHVLTAPADVHTAYALESVFDEVVFISGPILVTVLATAWHPLAGLGTAVVAAVIGTVVLAAQRSSEPPAHPRHDQTGAAVAMPWRAMAAIGVVCLALGMLFGSAEVITVAFSEELGVKSLSGLLLALWAAGSLVAGVVTGAVHWRMGPGQRLRYGTAALALAMSPLFLIGSIPAMAVALFVGGFAVAPTLIATNSLTEATVPRARLVEGMAIVHTGIAAGVAPGAAIAGLLIDGYGASVAYLLPLVAGAIAAAAAQVTPR
ncbi:MAG: MFS transporter [Nocardioidaceae bacterium]|nr:MFS transporter [Nocardioidaceae bacterium]